jgi:hypothetical protein
VQRPGHPARPAARPADLDRQPALRSEHGLGRRLADEMDAAMREQLEALGYLEDE